MILIRRTDFLSKCLTSPRKIRTSRYKCHISLSKIPNFIFSTFASNHPCRLGLCSSGSGSVKTPNNEFAAASTHSSIVSPPAHFLIKGTLVLAKFGSQIEPFVIPCSATPLVSNTRPSPEKSKSVATSSPDQCFGTVPLRRNHALSHFSPQLSPSLISL